MQVPLRKYFKLPADFLLDEASVKGFASNAAEYNGILVTGDNMQEIMNLRTTDFQALFQNKSTLLVRANGPVWYESE